MTKQNDAKKNRPVHKIKKGRIAVAIFRNEGENGAFHTSSVSRIYKHKQMGEWVETNSGYTLTDLERLIEAAAQAHNMQLQLDDIEAIKNNEATKKAA